MAMDESFLATLTVTVEDASTGLPLANVAVQPSVENGAPLMVGKTSETGEVRLGLMLYAPQQSSCSATITATKPRYEILRKDVLLSRKAPDGRSDGGDGQHRHYLSIKMIPKEIKVNLKVVVMEGGTDSGCKQCIENSAMDAVDMDATASHPEMQGAIISVTSSDGGDSIVQGVAGTNGVANLPLFVLDPTKLVVQATKDGYRMLSTVVPISEKDDKQTIEVALEMMRVSIVAQMAIKVQSLEDGASLHGAEVTVVRNSDKRTVAMGRTDKEGMFRTELTSLESASYTFTASMSGFLVLQQEISVAQSQPYDITLALRAPQPILLRVRVSSKEEGGIPVAAARVRLVGTRDSAGGQILEADKVVVAEGMSSIKGYAEFNLQRADLHMCMVEVYKEGWAPGQGVMPPAVTNHVTETKSSMTKTRGVTGKQKTQTVNVGVSLVKVETQMFDVELLVAVGLETNTVGMINIDAKRTTLREVRKQLRSEQLQGVIPLAYHFMLKGVPCGVQTEAHKLANDAVPILVLMPLPTVKPWVRSITPCEATVVWEHPAEAAIGVPGGSAYVVEVWCGNQAEEHRREAVDAAVGGGAMSTSSECAFVLDMFLGRPLVAGQQYDLCVRSASQERLREAVVPLTLRIPMTDSSTQGSSTQGNGVAQAHMDERVSSALHRSVLFYPNSSQWLEESVSVLDEVARVLRENAALRIQVRGFCNGGMGSINMEDELSWSRAANVCEYLVSHGSRPSQLELEGKGAQGMAVPPNGPDSFKNRRVEFRALFS